MKFIDLFAGLGGFHKALHELGHRCVFASEINPVLQELYNSNWGIKPDGDIKKIVEQSIDTIPEHDILCAGFPCQPFSKAGKQLGRDDQRGTLFDEIVKILAHRKPRYFILENVPFIAKHDNEETWQYMVKELDELGYNVVQKIYSPEDFGIPQHRKRIFIVGTKKGLPIFDFDGVDKNKTKLKAIEKFIDKSPATIKKISDANKECLQVWQEFIDAVPKEMKLPGFPIWSMEFGATYPFEDAYPLSLPLEELGRYKGNFGKNLKKMIKEEIIKNLPSYARVESDFPEWKKNYIRQNRKFYEQNKKYIQNVVKKIAVLPSQSWQKLEWNVGEQERNIFKYIIQFRASGIRVKKTDYFPSLVCTSTQIPIIGWLDRYITKEEGLKLQSLEGLKLPQNDNAAFQALGNAVNAKIVKHIAEELLNK